MDEKEKEKYILKFIYRILTDKRNQNRYCTTMFGNLDEDKVVRLGDCIKYLEDQIKFIEATDCDYYDEELELYQNRVKQFNTVLSMLEEKDKTISSKDKIIDLMAEYISNITDCPFESKGKYLDCEKMCDVRTDKECWKQYFENKAKEVDV